MEKRDDNAFLVTGNKKHFPMKPFIVTPSEMIDIIKKREIREDWIAMQSTTARNDSYDT